MEPLPPNSKTAYNTQTSHYRIIGIWHDETCEYRFYATNVPRRHLLPQHTAASYAARCEVELFFRELKTLFRGEQTVSKNRHVSECLLYAARFAVALSRRLLRSVAARLGQAHSELNIDRWARLVTSLTHDLLELIFCPRRHCTEPERRLFRLLRREAPDPNRNRLGLAQRAQLGWLACEL